MKKKVFILISIQIISNKKYKNFGKKIKNFIKIFIKKKIKKNNIDNNNKKTNHLNNNNSKNNLQFVITIYIFN